MAVHLDRPTHSSKLFSLATGRLMIRGPAYSTCSYFPAIRGFEELQQRSGGSLQTQLIDKGRWTGGREATADWCRLRVLRAKLSERFRARHLYSLGSYRPGPCQRAGKSGPPPTPQHQSPQIQYRDNNMAQQTSLGSGLHDTNQHKSFPRRSFVSQFAETKTQRPDRSWLVNLPAAQT
jgi:hypothetical protein